MIKNMDMENSTGQMEEFIKAAGKTENNTEEGSIKDPMESKGKENGKKEKKLNGLMIENEINN